MPALLVFELFDDVVEGVLVAAVLSWRGGCYDIAGAGPVGPVAGPGGVLRFGAATLWALSLDDPDARSVLATGWLGHAAWHVVHFRANRVVPRWWSEWCVVLDVILAVVLLLSR